MFKKIWNNEWIWGTIGKIISIFTLLTLLFGLFYWLFAPEDRPNLSTLVFISTFEYPPDLERKLSKYKDLQKDVELSAIFAKATIEELNLTEYQIHKISNNLSKYFENAWPWEWDSISVLPKFENYSVFHIENKSEIQAENVVIDLPFTSGITRIYSEGHELVTTAFNQTISIGTVRPNKSVVVRVWSENKFSESYEKEIQVTHKTGVSSIGFTRQTFSIPNAFKAHIGNFWFLAFEGLIVAILLVFLGFFKLGWWNGRRNLIAMLKRVSVCPSLPSDCALKGLSHAGDTKCDKNICKQ
jgi:hypothetical protein